MRSDWPEWQELGSHVFANLTDGRTVQGVIDYEDMTPGPDEQPLCFIKTEEGYRHSWSEVETWDYLPAES